MQMIMSYEMQLWSMIEGCFSCDRMQFENYRKTASFFEKQHVQLHNLTLQCEVMHDYSVKMICHLTI
jgi:hypothetical protein